MSEKYRQIILTSDKQFPIELFLNGRKRQKYTKSAAVELMKELMTWNTRTDSHAHYEYNQLLAERNELKAKLSEAVEVIAGIDSCIGNPMTSIQEMIEYTEKVCEKFISKHKEQL